MYYHELAQWVKAPNATGCVQRTRVIGSTATNTDEAYRERCKLSEGLDMRMVLWFVTVFKEVEP